MTTKATLKRNHSRTPAFRRNPASPVKSAAHENASSKGGEVTAAVPSASAGGEQPPETQAAEANRLRLGRTTPPTVRPDATRTSASRPRGVLAEIEAEFERVATGPAALCLDGGEIGHGLLSRPISLGELRELLLAPEADGVLKDLVWAALVRRARAEGGDWVTACVGMALPGLRNIAARALRHSPERLAEDIVAAMLTEFLAQLPRIDLDRPGIAPRLAWWGRKGALRERGRGLHAEPLDPHEVAELADEATGPACDRARGAACPSPVEPADLLELSVRLKVVTTDDAALIRATRLEGRSLRDYAHDRGEAASKLYSRRERAEARRDLHRSRFGNGPRSDAELRPRRGASPVTGRPGPPSPLPHQGEGPLLTHALEPTPNPVLTIPEPHLTHPSPFAPAPVPTQDSPGQADPGGRVINARRGNRGRSGTVAATRPVRDLGEGW